MASHEQHSHSTQANMQASNPFLRWDETTERAARSNCGTRLLLLLLPLAPFCSKENPSDWCTRAFADFAHEAAAECVCRVCLLLCELQYVLASGKQLQEEEEKKRL